MNPRLLATRVLVQVVFQGKSLNACVLQLAQQIENPKDRAFARELVSGVLRYYERLNYVQQKLLKKALKDKDSDVYCLLLIGLYQIFFMRVPDHAAVSETVKLAQKLKKNWAKGFLNGVLRQSIRDKDELLQLLGSDEQAKFSHPNWLISQLKNDWPDDYSQLLEQNLKQAPMILRVNQQTGSRQGYLSTLYSHDIKAEIAEFSDDAVQLIEPRDVQQLPGFTTGKFSVQDQAAQLAAKLVDLKPGNDVLDACAAPGGKTAHMLESEATINVLALDISQDRMSKVEENLHRLGLKAKTCVADAVDVEKWWDGKQFDRILLDAPCSAIGVIRRNPDIKIHRKSKDITQLVENQRKLIKALWQTLKPGGLMLYATCSVLKVENENQIAEFLKTQSDAQEIKIDAQWGRAVSVGRQILPGESDMDGFYYAKLQKKSPLSVVKTP